MRKKGEKQPVPKKTGNKRKASQAGKNTSTKRTATQKSTGKEATITAPVPCQRPVQNWNLCKKYPNPTLLPSGAWNINYRFKSNKAFFGCTECHRKNYSVGNFPSELVGHNFDEPTPFRVYVQKRFEAAAAQSCAKLQQLKKELTRMYADATSFNEEEMLEICEVCGGTGVKCLK